MSLRRITLISSAALFTIGSAVTPVAIAAADNAPPSNGGVVHTPRPVVTEVAPGSFTAVLAGVGTFSFKVDPVTRAVTDLVFTPAAGSLLTAGAPKIRDNGLQVVLRSSTAPKTAIEVEIEAEHGDDIPAISVHREFDADHRGRDHRDSDRDGAGRGHGNGSNGGPPTTVMTTPTTVTTPTSVTVPAPPTTTTTGAPTNSSPGGPPSVTGGNDAADHDADGDNDGNDQDRGATTGPNDQGNNDQVDNDHGGTAGHGGDGPSADQGDHDSQGGGSGGPGNSGNSGNSGSR
jgi:hypothetical protein